MWDCDRRHEENVFKSLNSHTDNDGFSDLFRIFQGLPLLRRLLVHTAE